MDIRSVSLSSVNLSSIVIFSVNLNFATTTYTVSGTTYGSLSAVPGWSFSNFTGGYSLDGTQAFAAGAPRINSSGLLVEAASTNLCFPSPNMNTGWSLYNATINGTATAPDGTNTATSLTMLANGAIYLGAFPLTNGTTYTMSCWVKWLGTGSSTGCLVGNPDAGTGTTFTTTTSWVRYTRTFTATGNNNIGFNANPSAAGDFVVWGFQIEVGTIATSLVSTKTAAATRASDVASLTYRGTPTSITVNYTGGSASVTLGSPINLGASSGGAWLNQNITSVVVQ